MQRTFLNQSGGGVCKNIWRPEHCLDTLLCSLSQCHCLLSGNEVICLKWPTIENYFPLLHEFCHRLVIDNVNFLPCSHFSFSFDFQHSPSFHFQLLCNFKLELLIKILMELCIPCCSLYQIPLL